jgi:hypothetical protein
MDLTQALPAFLAAYWPLIVGAGAVVGWTIGQVKGTLDIRKENLEIARMRGEEERRRREQATLALPSLAEVRQYGGPASHDPWEPPPDVPASDSNELITLALRMAFALVVVAVGGWVVSPVLELTDPTVGILIACVAAPVVAASAGYLQRLRKRS